jgi:hypothetical protein
MAAWWRTFTSVHGAHYSQPDINDDVIQWNNTAGMAMTILEYKIPDVVSFPEMFEQLLLQGRPTFKKPHPQ